MIITGDFNAGEGNPAVKTILHAGFTDTFRIMWPAARDVGTFHAFKGTRTGEKIEFIFTTPDMRTTQAAILNEPAGGRFASDHFPVTATIVIP